MNVPNLAPLLETVHPPSQCLFQRRPQTPDRQHDRPAIGLAAQNFTNALGPNPGPSAPIDYISESKNGASR